MYDYLDEEKNQEERRKEQEWQDDTRRNGARGFSSASYEVEKDIAERKAKEKMIAAAQQQARKMGQQRGMRGYADERADEIMQRIAAEDPGIQALGGGEQMNPLQAWGATDIKPQPEGDRMSWFKAFGSR